MATSTTFDFNLDIGDIVEESFELCGLEARTGYHFRTARRSLDLMLLSWQNKGLNLWTIKSASQALTAGTAEYALSAEKLDIIEGLMRTDAGDSSAQSDLHMRRVSVSTYARQTNKLQTGRPIQYWISRAPEALTVHMWPVPDATQTYTFFYHYMERIENSGTPGSNTVDVPARYLPALTAGLAYYIAMKKAPERAAALKMVYDEAWNLAADASREKAALRIVPFVSAV